ncbi:MAG: MarR family transcriptional regulator [Cyanobacteria bacterium P01_F01_bin.143]
MSDDHSKENEFLQLDEFLCFAIYSASHAMNRLYKPFLTELGLTYPQYISMVVLWEQDDRTVGDLCEKLFLESSTLTPLLKRLEKMGLIERKRDPQDERKVRISLTTDGRELRKKALTIPECIISATGLSKKEIINLQNQIFLLRETLHKAANSNIATKK